MSMAPCRHLFIRHNSNDTTDHSSAEIQQGRAMVLRTREIGIRMALGASVSHAMTSVGAVGSRATAVGIAVGLALCASTLPVMRGVPYGVAVYDVTTGIAVVTMLAAVSLLATAAQALRVARIDPARTLREE